MYCQPPQKTLYRFMEPMEVPEFFKEVLKMQGNASKKMSRLFGEDKIAEFQLPVLTDICIDESVQADLGSQVGQYELPMFNNVMVLSGEYQDYQYTGQFAKGQIYGKGTLFHPGLMRLIHSYFGNQGSLQHAGIDITQDIIYEGQYKDNLRHGKGIFMDYQKKEFYVGHFQNGLYSGQGVLIKESMREKYEGEFEEGQYHGEGVLVQDLSLYEGQFQRNHRHGKGTQKVSGQIIYQGWFKDNERHGQGSSYDSNEVLEYEGYFKEGVRHGYGKAYGPDGTIKQQGWFQEGMYKGYRRMFDDQESPVKAQPDGLLSKISNSQQRLIGEQIQQSQVKSHLYSHLYENKQQ